MNSQVAAIRRTQRQLRTSVSPESPQVAPLSVAGVVLASVAGFDGDRTARRTARAPTDRA